jgi:Domain of unknown function (DUF4276)
MKKRLFIYCEGQTEEIIVERLIRHHLGHHGVKVERPELAATSLDPAGQRGGFVNWDAIEADLRQTFASDHDPHLRFTTFLDVYAIPAKVLGLAGYSCAIGTPAEVEAVERAIESSFSEPRFKAYLQRHKLEALLLADLDALARVFHRDKSGILTLRQDIAEFANAEDINHGPSTHPSARLASAIAGYRNLKASNAYHVLAEAGIEEGGIVRSKCPRFDAWLKHWESWGAER